MHSPPKWRAPRLVALAVLVATLPILVHAQQPGQPVVQISGVLSNPRPAHGETVRLDVSIVNQGPGSIRYVYSEIRVEGGLIVGVRCGNVTEPTYRTDAPCYQTEMAVGSRANHSFDLQVGNSASVLAIDGHILTYGYGKLTAPAAESTSFHIDAPVERAAAVADLALTASAEPEPIPLGSPIAYRTTVTNLGPDAATDVLVISDDPFTSPEPKNVVGADCRMVESRTVCRIPTLAAGAQATIHYTRAGVQYPRQERRSLFVIASNSFDPVPANSSMEHQVIIGLSAELTRVLLPIVIEPTDGAFGSLWISEVSLFVDGSEPLFVFPTSYSCPILCPPLQLSGLMLPQRRFMRAQLIPDPENVGYLLRFDRRRAHEIAFSSRIRDVSRELETWGTAVPVVTDEELVNGRLQLIDIAAGSRFRQTLRIYEPDATGASVRVRVWGETRDETLLGEETLVLATPSYNVRPDYNAGLPFRPGYAQLDVSTRFPTASQYSRLRVEIEPLAGTTRYWAFVSITNNETQHVTLVTPEAGGKP